MTTECTITDQMTIKDGPNREAIFDSLRLRKSGIDPVEFTLFGPNESFTGHERWSYGQEHKLQAHIQGIRPEDGSGHKWLLEVRFLSNQFMTVTNRDAVDVYYCDGGGRYRREGHVVDARPLDHRPRITRNGEIRMGGQLLGHINDFPVAA